MFRAHEPAGTNHDRLVAVKVFRLDLTPEQANGLVAELNALVEAGLEHPNIAAPIAAGLEHGTPYLAQEYAVGDSLDVVLRERGPMPLADVVALVEAVAAGLDHASSRGVHHGSLHLRDILVSGDAVRITGAGIAAALTKIGARRPTRPQYSSPDEASDVYSLGAIAFEAATGRRVSPDHLAEFERQHGVELRGAFGLALAPNPEMRPDRAGDFAAVLRDAAEMTAEAELNTRHALGAVGASGVTSAAGATDADDPMGAAPDASIAPSAPVAPTAPDDDLDLHPGPAVDLMAEPAPDPAERLTDIDSALPAPLPAYEPPPEPAARRWPMRVVVLAFAVLAALSVGFYLRSQRPATPATDEASAVAETTVEIPAAVPPPSSAAPVPAPAAGAKRVERAPTPRAPSPTLPAPAPSRPASGAARRAETGSLLIRSTPADADVVVNGRARGKTPLALRDLPLGSYTIRVTRSGYAAEERTVHITAGRASQSTTIDLRSVSTAAAAAARSGPGGLSVQSRPAGARVFINDRLAGTTPVAIPGLPAGAAALRIELDGYQPWATTVRVNPGEQTTVGASLERQ